MATEDFIRVAKSIIIISSRYFTIITVLVIITQFVRFCIEAYKTERADMKFSEQHGCKLPLKISTRWPFGIDRLYEIWIANKEGRLLALHCEIAEEYNFFHTLLSKFLPFGTRVFHTMDGENIKAVLSTNHKEYSVGSRRYAFKPLIGESITTSDLDWKFLRELVHKYLSKRRDQNLEQFQSHMNEFLEQLPVEGGTVDLQPLFFRLTLDTTTALLLGAPISSLKGEDANIWNFEKNFEIALEGLSKRLRIAPFHFLYSPPSFLKACREVHKFVESYIEQAQDSEGFIAVIKEYSKTDEALKSHLINILLAGRETLACVLSWFFWLLIRYPEDMQTLREEIKSVLGDSKNPTAEQIGKMIYLRKVILELPLNNRTAIKTTVLPKGGGADGQGPILVRKGDVVNFSSYVNAQKKNIFGSDAEEFRPNRWDVDEMTTKKDWEYIPFHGGPRACLGQNYAMKMISYVVIQLLQTYPTLELPFDEPVEPIGSEKQCLTLFLKPAKGCRVRLSR